MDTIVSAKKLKGSIALPPFKSEVIRVLILNALLGVHPDAVLKNGERLCDDILAAKTAVENAFFAPFDDKPIYVGASAALLRMLAPLLLFTRGDVRFLCEPQLIRRDMSELQKTLGCAIELEHSKNTIRFFGGRLHETSYTVSAERSSQFASGMLIAAAKFGFDLRIVSPVSAPYIELTIECLRTFGCSIETHGGVYRIQGKLTPVRSYAFIPDMSYAANFVCADMLTGGSGDIAFIGAERGENAPDANAARLFREDEVCISSSPDLFPLLCVYALKKDRDTVFNGTARLADKESDRVSSVCALVNSLGGSMDVLENSVVVHGSCGKLRGGTVDSFGDHRIVMAASIASLMCGGEVTILGSEAVSKSAPRFFDDFRSLGGNAHELIRK